MLQGFLAWVRTEQKDPVLTRYLSPWVHTVSHTPLSTNKSVLVQGRFVQAHAFWNEATACALAAVSIPGPAFFPDES